MRTNYFQEIFQKITLPILPKEITLMIETYFSKIKIHKIN
jgi:hypothetical protein